MFAGSAIAHYQVLESIGAGGMGEVFLARDTKLDRDVALKVLPAAFCDDPDRHARFHREAKLLAAFAHPHVAGIHSLEEHDGRHFLVMELIEGEDLSAKLLRGPLPLERGLDIARQIALAIEAAHQHGIIHRDLKPANIKVDDEDQVKVLDFGLAKVYAEEAEPETVDNLEDSPTIPQALTRAGVIMGTAAYMSPEQARERGVDRRTDIWAFGCLLYEIFTGRRAFPGETLSDTLVSILRTEPDWDALPADLPPSIGRLIRRCLKKTVRQRLHDIADARIEIEEVLSGSLSGTAAPLVAESVSSSAPMRRGWLRIAAWTGWLAAAVVLFTLWPEAQGPDIPVRMQTLTYSGRDWAPAASPDGSMIAFTSDRDGVSRIWVKQMAGGGEAPLTAGPDDLPRFSPDGSQLVFVRSLAGRRSLYRTSLVGAQPRKVLDDVLEADWAPDGTRLCFLRMVPVDEDNKVAVGIFDMKTGTETILASVQNRSCYGVRWSPDGSIITFNEASLTGNVAPESFVVLVDPTSGELTRPQITDKLGPFSTASWSPDGRALVLGQADDDLAHVSGNPGPIMEHDLDSGRSRILFWSPFRIPRGGWGSTHLAVLDENRIVFDETTVMAQLHLVPWSLDGDIPVGSVLTSSLGRDRQPSYSPDGTQVIFSSNRSGNIDLWLKDLTSGQVRQLTDDPAHDWDPAFTPDGRILWSSDRSGNMEIWISAADGAEARQVSDDGVDAENPTMGADGQWIVYGSSSDLTRGIWKIRTDGTEATQIASGSNLLPEISPDGKYALYSFFRSLNTVIKVVDIPSCEPVSFEIELPITERHQDLVFGRARWSPDGRSIVFIGQDEVGRSGIYVQDFIPDADTSDSRRKLAGFSPDFATESLAVSPDGTGVVISAVYDRRVLKVVDNLQLEHWR